MTRRSTVTHEFVEFIPDKLDEGVLYISIPFGTAVHRCCCGCGIEVTTPLTRTDWRLIYDGESASLQPSIGNWSFPCQSHYVIAQNRVQWVARWSPTQIAEGRRSDRDHKTQQLKDLPDKQPTRDRDAGRWRRFWDQVRRRTCRW